MDNEYKTIYKQFEKNFREEAEAFITEEDIKSTLKMEKTCFSNAEKYNIPVNKFAGSSLARYTKDMTRQHQPLFAIYYILSIITEFFYCLLIWTAVKCAFLYLTDINKEAFSRKNTMSLSIIFFVTVIICNYVTRFYTRRLLYSCKADIKRKITVFNICCYLISAVIIVVSAIFIYLNKENYIGISLSLFQVFILAVAMLSVSGIHNVIYSSHFTSFITIGYAVIRRDSPGKDRAVEKYIQLSLKSFLIQHKTHESRYKEDASLQAEFKQWMRSKAVSLRTYGAIAFFILFILLIICLRQLVLSGISAGFIIFTIVTLLITIMLFIEILSCNYIIKSLHI